jgi:hypothetical protein
VSTLIRASSQPLDRHRAAVSSNLERTQESADRGDYADAQTWIYLLDAINEQIPPDYQRERRVWGVQLAFNTDRKQP